jgi:predicted nucleic acid-binding protein
MALTYRFEHIRFLGLTVVLTDANVLIYMYWPNVTPNKYTPRYGQAFVRLQNQGTRLVVTMGIISEATNRVFKERWLAWNQIQKMKGLAPVHDFKQFRDSPQGVAMREEINKVVKEKILKQVEIVGEKLFTNTEAEALFVADQMDLPDKMIAAVAKERGYIVFTHDGDFRYSDVDLLTVNKKILRMQRGTGLQKVVISTSNAPPPV